MLELFLLCSRLNLSSSAAKRISSLIQDEVDWDSFLFLAFRNSTVPVVYYNLGGQFSQNVPPDVLQTLRQHVHQIAAHNLGLSAALLQMLAALSEAGIAAMPLKGPTLAASYYGQLSLREFEDLDILVSQENLSAAEAVLTGLGFESSGADSKSGKHRVFRHPSNGTIVELHWALFETELHCRFNLRELWTSAQSVTLLGEPVPSLAAGDQFLFLATHGWRHGWESLKWICDIAQLIHHNPSHHWEATLNRAQKMGCLRIALLALGLAVKLLDAPLPASILSRLQEEPEIERWIEEIQTKLGSTSLPDPQATAEKALAGAGFTRFMMRSRERLPDRLRLLKHEVSLHLQPNRHDLGSWIVRPFRLARIYGLGCIAASSKALFGGLLR